MNMYDFVDAIFMRFPPKCNHIKTIDDWYHSYYKALECNKIYDYEAAYNDFCKNYKYYSLPSERTLISYLDKHVINRKNTALEHIYQVKQTPKIDFASISPEFRQKLLDFHKKYGIKTRIKELQNAR